MEHASNRPYAILVSVALDSTADVVLDRALELLEGRSEAELHLVHVVPTDALGAAEQMALLDRRMEQSQEHLRAIVEERVPNREGWKIYIHLRLDNDPARALVQASVDVRADILVVGSHRRRGLEKLLLGSVAEQVLREAHCPVLLALSKDYHHEQVSEHIEPPCPDCLEVRRRSKGEQFWCERHMRTYSPPHLYVPSDRKRDTLMPSI